MGFQRKFSFKRTLAICGFSVLCSACSSTHHLSETPNLYSSELYPAEEIAASEKTVEADIFYITDRNAVLENGVLIEYGAERSESMAFGRASVRYGEDISWEKLVEKTQSQNKKDKVNVRLAGLTEVGRFPPTPLKFHVDETKIIIDPEEERKYGQSSEKLREFIRARLAQSQRKDVVVYVHGFNNAFEDAIYALNDVWHFTGRHGVPIVYTWPSGSGNLLGYFADRESGEFTIHHLKEFMRLLSSIDEAENIHIIAHSRGTDITTSALRELIIEARASGRDPRTDFKYANLIMAAPDLDYGVVTQRLIAEKFAPAFGNITIYTNTGDVALGLSQRLMKGLRFGRLSADEQSSREDAIFRSVKNVTFINVEDVSGFVGHGYFRQHTGALSDIIRVITSSDKPGDPARPLTHLRSNFWSLNKNYLKENR